MVVMVADGKYSPVRRYPRIKVCKKCILRQSRLHKEGMEAFFVETLDYSEGGMGIIFNGEKLSIGTRFFVYIEPLNIIRKEARIVWIKLINNDFKAGFQWL